MPTLYKIKSERFYQTYLRKFKDAQEARQWVINTLDLSGEWKIELMQNITLNDEQMEAVYKLMEYVRDTEGHHYYKTRESGEDVENHIYNYVQPLENLF